MTRKEIEVILDTNQPTEEQLDKLEKVVDSLDHDFNCPRKFHPASECLCIRSMIFEVLSDNERRI